MELSSSVFTNILGPLAAFPWRDADDPASEPIPEGWDSPSSSLGPLNRVDSLSGAEHSAWRIDGAHLDGQRFFAVPIFALGRPPLRVDVHLPPIEELPRSLREVLQPEAALYVRRSKVPYLAISQHLVRALAHWSARIPDFQETYLSLPFGSQIVVSHLAASLSETEIHLVPAYENEQDLLAISLLQEQWQDRISLAEWPEVVDWTQLSFVQQLADNISLIRIPSRRGDAFFIFKSLTRDTRNMYHELKVLLRLRPHPNIVPRPLFVVEKRCRFGGKKGLCGFILEYFPLGNLQDRLAASEPATLRQRGRWARQIAAALAHITSHAGAGWFYPDLKPDNVVLRERADGETDAVLLDFEQRGGWFGWSPPEVLCAEYMEILATSLPRGSARREAQNLIEAHFPGWKTQSRDTRYRDVEGGFSPAWRALAEAEDRNLIDRAQVFMLGKLLWCIFELQPTVRCGMDHELLRDTDPDGPVFPEFRETPEAVCELIRRCISGAGELGAARRPIVLRGGELVLSQNSAEDERKVASEDVLEVARTWWKAEVDAAKHVMRLLISGHGGHRGSDGQGLIGQLQQRPLLAEVEAELQVWEYLT